MIPDSQKEGLLTTHLVFTIGTHHIYKNNRCHLIFQCKWYTFLQEGLPWSWSYGSWIYNYLCNQCLSPLKLWIRILFMAKCTDTTLSDKVCQWLVTGRWFSPVTLFSSTNKTDGQDITEILYDVTLNTITPIPYFINTTRFLYNKSYLRFYLIKNISDPFGYY